MFLSSTSLADAIKCLRTCKQCGKQFHARHFSKKGTYCSRPCLYAARSATATLSADDCIKRIRDNPDRWWWSRIEKTDGCWLWMRSIGLNGYGTLRYGPKGEQKALLVHRVSYRTWVGPIPDGLTIDHLCRTRNCVRPSHLEVVPIAVNILRGLGPTALNARKTHCPRGHEYTKENTYTMLKAGRSGRQCKACHRQRESTYRALRRTSCS